MNTAKGIKVTCAALVLQGMLLGVARAQDYEKLAPKKPEKTQKSSHLPEPKKRSPYGPPNVNLDEEILPELKGVVIVDSAEKVKRGGYPEIPPGGLEAGDNPIFKTADFHALISSYLGRQARYRDVEQLCSDIILFLRKRDRPLVDCILTEQDASNGVLQLIVLESRAGQITVEGNRWFKSEMLRKRVRLKEGDPIRERRLLSDLNWINRSPFRQVDLVFKQSTNVGMSDIVMRTADRFPLRFYLGYEDTGSTVTGDDRLLAGFDWGNVFGVDHQLSYRYTTDLTFDLLKAHSVNYTMPLPWRHELAFFGSYVDIKADLPSEFPSEFAQKGTSYQASMRYTAPLPSLKAFSHAVTVGFDHKHTDNNLEFGQLSVFDTAVDIAQVAAGYSLLVTDPLGDTTLSINGYYSPGGLFGNNDDESFVAARQFASANYMYARLTLERDTRLPFDFAWIIRGSMQFADGNLLASEQLGLGGFSTVRGYDERTANGDEGWFFSTELRTPAISFGKIFGVTRYHDKMQLLAFWDYGVSENIDLARNEDAHVILNSVGGGLRYTVTPYLSARFDYGFRIEDSKSIAGDSRWHLGVVASF
jgi:hemolysin activation/secretion protein